MLISHPSLKRMLDKAKSGALYRDFSRAAPQYWKALVGGLPIHPPLSPYQGQRNPEARHSNLCSPLLFCKLLQELHGFPPVLRKAAVRGAPRSQQNSTQPHGGYRREGRPPATTAPAGR